MAEGTSDHKQQEMLRAIIEDISSELELRPLLTAIVRYACDLLNAERGTIGLVDAKRNLIRTEATFNMPADEIGAEMAAGVGLAGRVLVSRAPMVLDAYGELASATQRDLLQDAVIGLPIWWRGEMIGFFGIGAPPPRVFTEHDIEILTLFARHAAIAIENARLFEAEKRRSARIAAITQIGHLIASSLSLEETLQIALDALCKYLFFPNIALMLVDPHDPEMLIQAAGSGLYAEMNNARHPISEGITGAAARSRQHILIADVRDDPRYVPVLADAAIRSELAVPIIVGNRLLGVLNIETEQPIDEADAEGVQIIADQLAVAIDNARLFGDVERALDERHLLYETSQRMSVAMDVDQVIEAYLQAVATGGRYRCSIVLYEFDASGQRTHVVVRGRWARNEGIVTGIEQRYRHVKDALDPLLDAGETISIANVFDDPRVTTELREIQQREGRPALVMIPLMVRRLRIGLVILSYPQVHEWTADELHSFQVTAAQLAAAIDSKQQAELLSERGQQLAVLRERQRLARDLHDSVTQLLFSITLIAQSVGAAWKRSEDEGEARVQRLLELSQSAQSEMRSLLAELRASEPETAGSVLDLARVHRDGLPAALKAYASTHADDGLHIEVDAHQYPAGDMPRSYEEALYRIAQEALSNAIRHSGAREIEIKIGASGDDVYLIVSDDGRGFVPEMVVPSASGESGLGLHTMRDRATALNGTLEISTAPESGTTVYVALPRVMSGEF